MTVVSWSTKAFRLLDFGRFQDSDSNGSKTSFFLFTVLMKNEFQETSIRPTLLGSWSPLRDLERQRCESCCPPLHWKQFPGAASVRRYGLAGGRGHMLLFALPHQGRGPGPRLPWGMQSWCRGRCVRDRFAVQTLLNTESKEICSWFRKRTWELQNNVCGFFQLARCPWSQVWHRRECPRPRQTRTQVRWSYCFGNVAYTELSVFCLTYFVEL